MFCAFQLFDIFSQNAKKVTIFLTYISDFWPKCHCSKNKSFKMCNLPIPFSMFVYIFTETFKTVQQNSICRCESFRCKNSWFRVLSITLCLFVNSHKDLKAFKILWTSMKICDKCSTNCGFIWLNWIEILHKDEKRLMSSLKSNTNLTF